MSYLVLFARKMSLKSQINDKNYQLLQKRQELQDLQSYTAAIADGEVSMNDLTTAPASMFGRMSQYMVGSHNYATAASQQNYAYLQGAQQTGTPQDMQAQQQYQYLVMKNLYDQQKAQFQKAEQQRLHVKEKQMENQCLKVEQELKLLQSEYDSMAQTVDKAAQSLAPQYVA